MNSNSIEAVVQLEPNKIKHVLEAVPKRTDMIDGYVPSAVLMLFFDRNSETHIIYIRRTSQMRLHSGNMAFPGGKIDPGETSRETAMRETHEEIGLEPRQYTYLGEMGFFETLSSGFDAAAHVAWCDRAPSYRINRDEVAEVVEIPLAALLPQFRPDLDYSNHEEVTWLNFRYQNPGADKPANLWGLTARITHHFLEGVTRHLRKS